MIRLRRLLSARPVGFLVVPRAAPVPPAAFISSVSNQLDADVGAPVTPPVPPTALVSKGQAAPVPVLDSVVLSAIVASFTSTERKYPAHERELLAMVIALRSWRHRSPCRS
jgi:hypothetical protein